MYVPAVHAEHVPPSGPEYPLLHTHASGDVLAFAEAACVEQFWQTLEVLPPTVSEYWSGLHALHAALPFVALYVPAAHAVQCSPLSPVNPGLHSHCVLVGLAVGP